MVSVLNPYLLLGISPQASRDEIEEAYANLAQRFTVEDDHKKQNQAHIQQIQAAYALLTQTDGGPGQSIALPEIGLSLNTTLSKNSVISLPEPQIVYVLVNVLTEINREAYEPSSKPINLTLVIDQSYSMLGTGIEQAKLFGTKLVDELTETDIFSLISINEEATLLTSPTANIVKGEMKDRISRITAFGATELSSGLSLALQQNRLFQHKNFNNIVVLVTDGNTFEDHDSCIELGKQAFENTVTLVIVTAGTEANYTFLKKLNPYRQDMVLSLDNFEAVWDKMQRFIREPSPFIRNLMMWVALDKGYELESVFQLEPIGRDIDFQSEHIHIGASNSGLIRILLQLRIPPALTIGTHKAVRIYVSGEIDIGEVVAAEGLAEIELAAKQEKDIAEPPSIILDALSKLTLYRLQQKAQDALQPSTGNLEANTFRDSAESYLGLLEHFRQIGETELAESLKPASPPKSVVYYQTRLLVASSDDE
ncbi:MAG: VWA domain-containing protein [Anaerolineae bacterium]|nr:VWA domain-containing protein [Anaerolineae bacterium]